MKTTSLSGHHSRFGTTQSNHIPSPQRDIKGCALKRLSVVAAATGAPGAVSKNDEFCIKIEKSCIKNEELCIKHDEFCRQDRLRSVEEDLSGAQR